MNILQEKNHDGWDFRKEFLSAAFTSVQHIDGNAVGCFAGTFIGMLPGLGPISAIALMIPITYGMEPSSGLILIAGVYYGAIFGGSTSSILIQCTRSCRNCSFFL